MDKLELPSIYEYWLENCAEREAFGEDLLTYDDYAELYSSYLDEDKNTDLGTVN